MNISEAKEIITALATGRDPYTGNPAEQSDHLLSPAVIRALFIAREALSKQEQAEQRKRFRPRQTGARWTSSEEDLLSTMHERGESIVEIARKLERSHTAVRARLIKLGKLEDDGKLRFAA